MYSLNLITKIERALLLLPLLYFSFHEFLQFALYPIFRFSLVLLCITISSLISFSYLLFLFILLFSFLLFNTLSFLMFFMFTLLIKLVKSAVDSWLLTWLNKLFSEISCFKKKALVIVVVVVVVRINKQLY